MSQMKGKSPSPRGTRSQPIQKAGSQKDNDEKPTVGEDHNYSRRGPILQAYRDTPPSSQQFASWTVEQRLQYKEEVIWGSTRRLAEELADARKIEEWYRAKYEEELRRNTRTRCSTCGTSSSSDRCSTCSSETLSSQGTVRGMPARVAAVRAMNRSGYMRSNSLDSAPSGLSSESTRATGSQGSLDD